MYFFKGITKQTTSQVKAQTDNHPDTEDTSPVDIVDKLLPAAETSTSTTSICGEDDNGKLTSKTLVNLRLSAPILPIMNKLNYGTAILMLPTGVISVAEIKSAQPQLQKAEFRLLSRVIAKGTPNTIDWMVDSVVSGFYMTIADLKKMMDA
ncbi:MAG: hypothetical protein V4547_16575 [Bacteroidota bacterium]